VKNIGDNHVAGKSKKILLIEGDRALVDLVRASLDEEGFTLIVTPDGPDGMRRARQDQPDLVIVDFNLPSMTGNEVCKILRTDPATDHMPLLMLAEESQLKDLEIGQHATVDDFIVKPIDPADLVAKVGSLVKTGGEDDTVMISTGNGDLDSKMGGGVPLGSLLLIEGDSGAGKSVLAQQLIHGCLVDGYKLSLFTSENTVKSLVKQMRTLNLDILDYLLLDRLRIFPIETSHLERGAPRVLVNAMKNERGRNLIFVDSITSAIPQCTDKDVIGFFEECKRLSGEGLTVGLVVHSHSLTRELLTRIRSLCDAHLQLRTDEMAGRVIKSMEVTKVRGAEQTTGNIVSFEVEPGWGMRIIPINKVKG
jgi:flagellar protein FlaH